MQCLEKALESDCERCIQTDQCNTNLVKIETQKGTTSRTVTTSDKTYRVISYLPEEDSQRPEVGMPQDSDASHV